MGQRLFQRSYGLTNQLRTVIERYYGNLRDGAVLQLLLRHAALHLCNLRLHIVDDIHGIGAIARYHYATDGLLAFLVQSTSAVTGSEVHFGHILHTHRHSVTRRNGRIL